MNRRQFIKGIGLFTILPGAGRVWKATRFGEGVIEWRTATIICGDDGLPSPQFLHDFFMGGYLQNPDGSFERITPENLPIECRAVSPVETVEPITLRFKVDTLGVRSNLAP